MLEFFERAYFAELERKSKLHSALAFPFSVMVVGVTLFAFAIKNWPFAGCMTAVVVIPLIGAGGTMIAFAVSASKFLIGRHYEYIWTLNDMLMHRKSLQEFSEQYPDAPAADDTFRAQLERDIAFCTSHNSMVNDQRSENLYYANASSLVFVLISLVCASIALGAEFVKVNYG